MKTKDPINGTVDTSAEVIRTLLETIKNQDTVQAPGTDVFLKLQRTTSNVVRTSLRSWQTSYEEAIDVDDPDREALLELYEQIEIDPHVSALIETIYTGMIGNGFIINGADGKEDLDAQKLFERPWFSQFMSIALDSFFWGFSGVQFTGVTNGCYAGSKSIPRYHIIPELGGIRYNDSGGYVTDILFEDRSIYPWTVFMFPLLPADQYKLGKFNKIAKMFILKREVMQFWAIFNELFGIPFRTMKTSLQDATRMQNAVTAMETMTAAAYSIIHEDDEIEFHNGAAASSVTTFKDFIEMADKQISKVSVGSTMVLEDGSSRSQGEVHERNTNAFIVSYGKTIAEYINFQVIPKMAELGFKISAEHTFKWDTEIRLGKKEMVELISQLKKDYDIPIDFVIEKTGVPVTEKVEPIPGDIDDIDEDEPELDEDGNPIDPPPEPPKPPKTEKGQNISIWNKMQELYFKSIKTAKNKQKRNN